MEKYKLPYLSFWTNLVLKKHKPTILGITGTAGKTTVTQLLGHVLMQKSARPYIGVAGKTYGNKNGDIGLRTSILGDLRFRSRLALFLGLPFISLKKIFSTKYPKVLVLEYGTYSKGHIHDLVKFAPPQIGIVTNIGPAHLERHKTVEGVYKEKRALVQAVPAEGLVVLGIGHEFISQLKADSKAPVIEVEGRGLQLAEQITRVVCKYLRLPEEVIQEGINSYVPPQRRLHRFDVAGITVLDDTYNANPLSMKYGLDILANEKAEGRKVAILGAMAELGGSSMQYHKELGSYAKKSTDYIIGVGVGAENYYPDQWFADSTECAENIPTFLKKGDFILIKGSNSSKMDIITQQFKEMTKEHQPQIFPKGVSIKFTS